MPNPKTQEGNVIPQKLPLIDDVLARVIVAGGCWFWQGGHGSQTKDRPYVNGYLVYRLLFQHFRGPIPKGLVMDHVVCDNPRCVNPWHVEPRTQKQNLSRANCASNLGSYLGNADRVRNELGQFTGG